MRVHLLAEIERRGYENVTMTDLAAAVQVSARTLHRYFPAKADIVWGGIDTSIDVLREGLRAIPTRAPLLDSVASVVRAVLDRNAEDLATMRARLRLIARSPELRSRRADTFDGWRDELTTLVADRWGESVDSLVAIATGAALHAAVTSAVMWWATQDAGGDPGQGVDAALEGIRRLVEFPPGPVR